MRAGLVATVAGAAGAVATLLVVSCSATRQGTLVRIPSGPTMAATVTIEGDRAEVTATDPSTGEVLTGQLTADTSSRSSGGRGIAGPVAGGGPGTVASTAPPPGGTTSATLDLAGELAGDQGTRLRCAVQVEKRIRLRGSGVCRPLSGHGETLYRLTF
jgi:hypothetical protein